MSQAGSHDPQGSGWRSKSARSSGVEKHDDGLETIVFTGENFIEVSKFLLGCAHLLGPNAVLVDAPDRAFLVRRWDVIIRYPNGTIGRCRPGGAIKAAEL